MAGNKEIIPSHPQPQYDLDAKWDACLDLSLRRFFYSSLAGAFGGLLLFRSPKSRWASVAFGAGVGIGSAYTECCRRFDESPTKLAPPKVSETPTQKSVDWTLDRFIGQSSDTKRRMCQTLSRCYNGSCFVDVET